MERGTLSTVEETKTESQQKMVVEPGGCEFAIFLRREVRLEPGGCSLRVYRRSKPPAALSGGVNTSRK